MKNNCYILLGLIFFFASCTINSINPDADTHEYINTQNFKADGVIVLEKSVKFFKKFNSLKDLNLKKIYKSDYSYDKDYIKTFIGKTKFVSVNSFIIEHDEMLRHIKTLSRDHSIFLKDLDTEKIYELSSLISNDYNKKSKKTTSKIISSSCDGERKECESTASAEFVVNTAVCLIGVELFPLFLVCEIFAINEFREDAEECMEDFHECREQRNVN